MSQSGVDIEMDDAISNNGEFLRSIRAVVYFVGKRRAQAASCRPHTQCLPSIFLHPRKKEAYVTYEAERTAALIMIAGIK